MRNHVLFEHESLRSPSDPWTTADQQGLEVVQRRLGGVEVLRPTWQGGQLTVCAAQYVGVLRLGRQSIEILPKMYRTGAPAAEARQTATRNLLHLLAYTRRLPLHEHAVAPLLRQDAGWFEILTRLFATHLAAEWQRGAYRGYQPVDAELGVLKGKWHVATQARRPATAHRFTVTYDAFEADNALNRVFRYVVERLWQLTGDPGNRRLLGQLRGWLEEVTLVPHLTAAAAPPTLITRLNTRFEPVLNLARLFLAGDALQPTGGTLNNFAFVFDMNRLFEEFVAGFLARHRQAILPPAWQSAELLAQSRGASRHLAQRDGRAVFRLAPDLALRQGATFPLLIDTKYKPLTPADRRLGVAQSDMYQMYSYAHRYDCPRILLLYPQTAAAEAIHARFVSGSGPARKIIIVATVDLRGDLGQPSVRQALVDQLRCTLAQVAQEDL